MFIFDRVVPPPSAFGIILVNNPDTSPDPSILKVGANQGYIVAFGKYRQDSNGQGDYLTKPIAWRILDSENTDHNSNLSLQLETLLLMAMLRV